MIQKHAPTQQVEPDPQGGDATGGTFSFDDRHWRVRGLERNTSHDRLKVVVRVERDGLVHLDSIDLYVARQRSSFVKRAAIELFVDEPLIQKDLGHILCELEQLQDRMIHQAQAPDEQEPAYAMSEQERRDAMDLLKMPDLTEQILTSLERCGLIGERTNKLVAYLAATSRKLPRPLAVVVQSSSAAGKTSLMDGVLAFLPAEDVVRCSALTGQALFYMGRDHLKHKVLAVAEEAGAQDAAYALKLLQSDGRLSLVTTERDGHTQRSCARHYQVEGPTAILLTTTAIDVDEELLNRSLVLGVNEDREQTQAIHRQQRLARMADQKPDQQQRCLVQQNAQRLLKPLSVVNPYADQLTFPDSRTRHRRDHQNYLTLIDTITLLHQRQRTVLEREVEGETLRTVVTDIKDIELANQLVHELLGRSVDELPAQTVRLLHAIDAWVDERARYENRSRRELRFTRRQLREHTRWGHTQLKVHLRRLEEMEYVIVHRAAAGRSHLYELAYERAAEDGGGRHLAGLTDAARLKSPAKLPTVSQRSPLGRGQVGPKSAPGRTQKTEANVLPQSN